MNNYQARGPLCIASEKAGSDVSNLKPEFMEKRILVVWKSPRIEFDWRGVEARKLCKIQTRKQLKHIQLCFVSPEV